MFVIALRHIRVK